MDENQPREISNNDLLFGETFFVTLNVHTGKMFFLFLLLKLRVDIYITCCGYARNV